MNIHVQHKITEDKDVWMKKQREELENLQQKLDNLNLHGKLKELTGINKHLHTKLSDPNNQPINSSKEEI